MLTQHMYVQETLPIYTLSTPSLLTVSTHMRKRPWELMHSSFQECLYVVICSKMHVQIHKSQLETPEY